MFQHCVLITSDAGRAPHKLLLVLPKQKNWVKMVPKQVFTRAGIKSPPPYSMSIPEAPSCSVNPIPVGLL